VTTAVHRPHTVTARIDTVDSTPAPAVYTATVYMNTAPHSYDGYQHHHPLAEATRPDGSPLRLAFHAGSRIRSHEAAADAAFTVGNRQGPDDNGLSWPTDVRSVSVGDVIKVTGPDHWIVYLSVDPFGFSAVPEPTILVSLVGSRASGRTTITVLTDDDSDSNGDGEHAEDSHAACIEPHRTADGYADCDGRPL